MDADPRMAPGPVTEDGHVGSTRLPLEDLPEDGGRDMAQDRLAAARLDRGEEEALERNVRMANRVNAAVQRMKPAALDSPPDAVLGQSAFESSADESAPHSPAANSATRTSGRTGR